MFRSMMGRTLSACVLVVVLAGSSQAQTGPIQVKPTKGNLHILAVGVNNAIGQPLLKSADKDAHDEVKFWQTQQGKAFENVYPQPVLTNEQATCQAVEVALNQWVEKALPGDTAILSLAGHGGFKKDSPEWGFSAYDGRITSSMLRQRVERLAQKNVTVLLIVDCCQSGGIAIQGNNIIVLAACMVDQGALDGADNGLFTKVLLEGLSGAADFNKDGTITLAELDLYVSQQLDELTAKLAKKQSPTCSRPPNVKSSLPLAMVAPVFVPSPGH